MGVALSQALFLCTAAPSRLLSVSASLPTPRSLLAASPAARAAPLRSSIPELLLMLSKTHSNPTQRVKLRRYLDSIQSLYLTRPEQRGELRRGHVSLLMKAAHTCQHHTMALWLLETFYPSPTSPPSASTGPWPRDVELAFLTITESVDGAGAPQSPRALDALLQLMAQHGWPVVPSMLTPALMFYRQYEAWQEMCALHAHCVERGIPVSHSAYPLILRALNVTRQWETALAVVADAESRLLHPSTADRLPAIYHAAIDCLGVCGQSAAALALFERMRAIGVQPVVESYTAVINAAGKPGTEPGSAVECAAVLRRLHSEVQASGLSFTQPLYRALIRGYLNVGAQEEAMPLMQRLVDVHHDAASHFFVLSVCIDVDNVDAALVMLDKVRERRQHKSEGRADRRQWLLRLPVFNRVLELCVRRGKWKAVRRVWDMRLALSVSPNILSLYLVAQSLKPDTPSWHALLAKAVPLLPLNTSAPHFVLLDLPSSHGEATQRAALWWALKAAQHGWPVFDDKDLHVTQGDGRLALENVAGELQLPQWKWRRDGTLRIMKEDLQRWKEAAPAPLSSAPQRAVGPADDAVEGITPEAPFSTEMPRNALHSAMDLSAAVLPDDTAVRKGQRVTELVPVLDPDEKAQLTSA